MIFRKTLKPFILLTVFVAGVSVVGCSTRDAKPNASPTPQGSNSGSGGVPGKSSQPSSPQIQRFDPMARNSIAAQNSPYIILVSLDGFRFDYAQKYGASQLLEMAKEGVAAKSMIPVYPSKTFPNHYSIVTGLYTDEHGIVSNEFFDPGLNQSFSMRAPNVMDSIWWQGEPLWITAQKNGHLSASFFWVGSEANITGRFPNWYVKFDETVSHQDRINTVVDWLKLPEAEKPHFITLYFSEVDTAGHKEGPDSTEVAQAVRNIDHSLLTLRTSLKALNLPINLIVVSDHGMEKLDPSKAHYLDEIFDASAFITNGTGTMMKFYLKPNQPAAKIDEAMAALGKVGGDLKVYRRGEMANMHYSKSERIGDFVVVMDAPSVILLSSKGTKITGGNHGWDAQKFKNMQGIFYAEGPAFKKGVELESFENIHVYPLVAKILGYTKLPKISGNLKYVESALSKKEKFQPSP